MRIKTLCLPNLLWKISKISTTDKSALSKRDQKFKASISVLNNDMFLQSQWMYICIFEETCSISFFFYFAILKIKVRGLFFFVTILNKSYLNVIRNVNDVRYIHVLSLWWFMKYSNIK